MLKSLKTAGSKVLAQMMAHLGPTLKNALHGLKPTAEFHYHTKVFSKDSRFHVAFGGVVDASIDLPGDLDDAASGAVNASGIVALGNSPQASSEPGTSPSN